MKRKWYFMGANGSSFLPQWTKQSKYWQQDLEMALFDGVRGGTFIYCNAGFIFFDQDFKNHVCF